MGFQWPPDDLYGAARAGSDGLGSANLRLSQATLRLAPRVASQVPVQRKVAGDYGSLRIHLSSPLRFLNCGKNASSQTKLFYILKIIPQLQPPIVLGDIRED